MSASMTSQTSIDNFVPPSALLMRSMLTPARMYFSPKFLGLEGICLDRPALWVGNHTLYGLIDVPLMLEHLYTQHNTMLRSLGDRGHFMVPGWKELLIKFGMVLGTRENCSALMRGGQHVLVFPGGGREVMRHKDDDYKLIWKERVGFVNMAIAHGYDIIPFGAVGANENFDLVLDSEEIHASRAWKWLSRHTQLNAMSRDGEMIPPIVRGIGLSVLPRPQRYYFKFGARISTSPLAGQESDLNVVLKLRQKVALSIQANIRYLKKYRIKDRRENWSSLRRLLAPIDPK
jgi:1-acyl-sn-glycerol-3-phosphate acyltransferase